MTEQPTGPRPDLAESETLPTEHSTRPFSQAALITEIKDVADKLKHDNATRGDLKILSRALKELRYAFKVFKPFRQIRKVSAFGSARTATEAPAYQSAVEFGKKMAGQGWMVLTGAGGGIMEACHVGAGKEMSIGVNIVLPFEQDANYVISNDQKLINLKYFFTRKLLFVKEVHAIALFPGGFGTQDEGFEAITLVQTGKRDLMPIVCIDEPGGTYWTAWKEFVVEQLLHRRLISPADMSLFMVTDSVDAAITEILQFYRVFHSMRFVRKKLVLRLNQELSDAEVERLNEEFGDIVTSGRIRKATALPQEWDDPHLQQLPRLVLNFNRREVGRLRQMIDRMNRLEG